MSAGTAMATGGGICGQHRLPQRRLVQQLPPDLYPNESKEVDHETVIDLQDKRLVGCQVADPEMHRWLVGWLVGVLIDGSERRIRRGQAGNSTLPG
jgi:hypothetical protein